MAKITATEARTALQEAELLYPEHAVETALDRLAAAITDRLQNCDPLVLVVMNGALIPAGLLLSRLDFPLQIDYLHATRYCSGTRGGTLNWIARPSVTVANRTVLVVDDIFDEGITLKAILDELWREGAREVFSAVLINKIHDRKEFGLEVDFVGLEVADRYVFGYGMDYKEYLRNVRGIYAIKDSC